MNLKTVTRHFQLFHKSDPERTSPIKCEALEDRWGNGYARLQDGTLLTPVHIKLKYQQFTFDDLLKLYTPLELLQEAFLQRPRYWDHFKNPNLLCATIIPFPEVTND